MASASEPSVHRRGRVVDISVGARRQRPQGMYDLCASLVAADHWPAEGAAYSWGDAEIAQRAAMVGGPGNAAGWRAWGTAHHLTHVVKMLEDSHDQLGG